MRRERENVATAPVVTLLKLMRSADEALRPRDRIRRVQSALEEAGLDPCPPRSGLLTAYHNWSFSEGEELCCIEVVAVRFVVDSFWRMGRLSWLPERVSTWIESSLRDYAVNVYCDTGHPWRPTCDELKVRLKSVAAQVKNEIVEDIREGYDDREDEYSSSEYSSDGI